MKQYTAASEPVMDGVSEHHPAGGADSRAIENYPVLPHAGQRALRQTEEVLKHSRWCLSKLEPMKKVARTLRNHRDLIAVIGFAILSFAVSRAIGDFQNLGTMDTVRTIAFPPLMSIAFIPFIYCLVVIVTYESIFIRLAVGPDKAPDVIRYAKRRILFHCGLSLRRLRAFAKRPPFEIMQVESSADVDRLFTST